MEQAELRGNQMKVYIQEKHADTYTLPRGFTRTTDPTKADAARLFFHRWVERLWHSSKEHSTRKTWEYKMLDRFNVPVAFSDKTLRLIKRLHNEDIAGQQKRILLKFRKAK